MIKELKAGWHKMDFMVMGDERGSLTALESTKNIPFQIQRVYFIYHTLPNVRRGLHAHKDLQQVAICVAGSCKFLVDDGKNKEVILLDKATKGLYIGAMVWREMFDFTEDCVLMVLANRHYEESDYIRSYQHFLELVPNG